MKYLFIGLLCLFILQPLLYTQVPTQNLKAYYPLNGNAQDRSGNSKEGVVFGAESTENRVSEENMALFFDGSQDYIQLPDSVFFPYNELTISLWFKTCRNGVLIGQQDVYHPEVPNKWIPMLYMREDGKINAKIWTETGTDNPMITDERYDDDQWHHLVLRSNQNSQQLIIDNVIVGSVLQPILRIGVKKNQIGTGYTGGSWESSPDDWFFFKGSLDDIRVYSRALDPTEILALYNEEPCSDIVFSDTTYYKVSSSSFEENSPGVFFNYAERMAIDNEGCDTVINYYAAFEYEPNYYTDTLLVTVEDTLNIELPLSDNSGNESIEIKIYPNPTTDLLIIDLQDYLLIDDYSIRLINVNAMEIWQKNVSQSIYEVDLSSFSKGMYFIEIYDREGKKKTVKTIVLQ